MKRILTLCLLFLAISADAGECPPVKARNPQGNYIVPGVMGDIVYKRIDGIDLSLDAYLQKSGARRPAVVVVHGGGWNTGSRIAFVGQFLELLTTAGYTWFSIDYRKNRVDAERDLRDAISFIRCHAREFRVDPDRIAILGEDTGAQLALQTAAEAKAVISVGGRFDPDSLSVAATEALFVHGAADREVPVAQAEKLCSMIEQAKGRCSLISVENGIHRAENWRPEQWGYKEKLIAWLNGRFKHRTPGKILDSANLKKNILFSPGQNLKLDAYIPDGRGLFPAVIIAHGGGWEAGDKVTYATPVFEPLARAGFAWFSIDYRLTPQFSHRDQLEDLRQAIRFVRNNARRFRIDPKRIAILGESASGQMVAQIATENPKDVAAVVSFYGVYDFTAMAREITPRSIPTRLFGITKLDDQARALLQRYSPIFNAKREMPPMLLICGTNDGLYAQHQAFLQKLDLAGAGYDSYTVDGAPHGMENWEGHENWMGYKLKLVEWLSAALK